ncbi:MAG: hypothetical protein KDC98_05800 [Planctomycetes bacterium]|nr:hypothetical protein [Planctomycetota bacterium]
MKSNCLAVLLLSLPLAAQGDLIIKTDGTKIERVSVTGFDIREIKYKSGGSAQSLSSDQVAKVDLENFQEVFRLGLRDADLMLTKARETMAAKDTLMAQFGFVAASAMLFDSERAADAAGALDELEKGIPDAGLIPEVYRQKFEYYMGQGPKGANSANSVAKKYLSAAQGNAWPAGFTVEADFFIALSERSAGGDTGAFQGKLRSIIERGRTANVMVANRANVQLANSLRETKDADGARRIYETLANKEGVDSSTRAGSYLGLGMLTLDAAGNDQNENKRALLWFLRVYLETRDAWPSLQAEALYHAVLAAGKWRGSEYQYIMARCRGVLKADFPGSDWTQRALAGR